MAQEKARPKKILELLEDDHHETLQMADRLQDILIHLGYEGKPSLGKNLKEAKDIWRFFDQEVSGHMASEEKLLFPFLQAHIPKVEPLVSLLCSEHQDFRKNVGCFKFLLDELTKEKNNRSRVKVMEKLKETGNRLVYLLQGHLREESEILYKVADRELRPSEKKELQRKIRQRTDQRR